MNKKKKRASPQKTLTYIRKRKTELLLKINPKENQPFERPTYYEK
jgi:hypothetical protein